MHYNILSLPCLSLHASLFTHLLTCLLTRLRASLQADLSDDNIQKLIAALDDDGGGHLSIDEISDFIERGSATFNDGAKKQPLSAHTASAADGAADEAADGPASDKSLLEMISTQPQVGAVQRPWTADDNMLREADSQGLPGQLLEERPSTAPVLAVKNVHRPEGNAVTPPTLGTGLKKHRRRGMPKAFAYPWLSKGGTGRTIAMQASAVPTRIARSRSAHTQAGR